MFLYLLLLYRICTYKVHIIQFYLLGNLCVGLATHLSSICYIYITRIIVVWCHALQAPPPSKQPRSPGTSSFPGTLHVE